MTTLVCADELRGPAVEASPEASLRLKRRLAQALGVPFSFGQVVTSADS